MGAPKRFNGYNMGLTVKGDPLFILSLSDHTPTHTHTHTHAHTHAHTQTNQIILHWPESTLWPLYNVQDTRPVGHTAGSIPASATLYWNAFVALFFLALGIIVHHLSFVSAILICNTSTFYFSLSSI